MNPADLTGSRRDLLRALRRLESLGCCEGDPVHDGLEQAISECEELFCRAQEAMSFIGVTYPHLRHDFEQEQALELLPKLSMCVTVYNGTVLSGGCPDWRPAQMAIEARERRFPSVPA